MSPSAPTISTLALAALLLTTSTTSAQLLGCDAVGCPVDEYRNTHCSLGNATLKAMGIANVTTSLDSRPLTWTLGLQELDNDNNGTDTQVDFDRNFYLGTPPSLQLNDTKSCALFFEGVAAKFTAPNAVPTEEFTCKNVLAEPCIADLVTQTQNNYRSLLQAGNSNLAFCAQLRDSLANQPPATCTNATGSWGAITAQSLTGSDAAQPIPNTECHATTGHDYALYLVSSSRTTAANRTMSELDPIVNAVTPVMTVFGKGNDAQADVQVSCLKLVESQEGRTVDVPAEGAGPVVRSGPAIWAGMVAATWLWYVLV